MTQDHASVERTMAASAADVWSLISDITRMGDWSPESTGCTWTGGSEGPALGARFKGTNSHGSKSWTSDCVVTACEPGRTFAFDVKAMGMKVAHWSYDLEATEGGCRVVESWQDRRGAFVSFIGPRVTGTRDRAGRNVETMTQTLDALAAEAEKS